MDFNEFKERISHKNGRNFKVKGSVGVYDMYKKIRKNCWYNIGRPVTEKEFYAIIRGINKMLADEIANGNPIVFPKRMGKLELRKHECGAFIRNGKLKITYPVDWMSTYKLWYEDEEARRNKTLLRHENKWIYHVKYCVFDATYENKGFYQFALNNFIKEAISSNVKQGKIDALW